MAYMVFRYGTVSCWLFAMWQLITNLVMYSTYVIQVMLVTTYGLYST
jgi:hypothetical protein